MRRLLAVATLLLLRVGDVVAAPRACGEAFLAITKRTALKKIEFSETVTHWVTPLHFGEFELLAAPPRNSYNRKVIGYFPKEDPDNMMKMQQIHDPVSVELMPMVTPHASEYYAVSSLDQKTGKTHIKLFDIKQSGQLKEIINVPLELTWETYARRGTVDGKDIESFKATEDALPPQRKVIFVASKNEVSAEGRPNSKILAVMRFFDGSPYPAMYVGRDHARSQVPLKAQADPRIPIERRYSELNLRETTEDIFEAGRLAADPSLDGVLKIQLYNMGAYLKAKFGFEESPPGAFAERGRVYAEITGQHLKTYMEASDKGGLGFTIFAAAATGQSMRRLDARTPYSELKSLRIDPEARFVLYKTVSDVIRDFYTASLTSGAKRTVPAFKPNQNETFFESPFDAKYHRPMPADFRF